MQVRILHLLDASDVLICLENAWFEVAEVHRQIDASKGGEA